jgi:hypothetical protein
MNSARDQRLVPALLMQLKRSAVVCTTTKTSTQQVSLDRRRSASLDTPLDLYVIK